MITNSTNNYYNNEDIIIINKAIAKDSISASDVSIENITNIVINGSNYINNFNIIGKGSYGKIYKFTNTINKNDSYVIKEYIDKIDYVKDKLISMILYNINRNHNINLNIIKSYWNDHNMITIMDGYSGDLYNLIYREKFLYYNPIDIFLQISKSISTLYSNEVYYCDLKLSNILFNIKNNDIECILGDIGGIYFKKNCKFTNIFADKTFEGNFIMLKPMRNVQNYCLVGISLEIDTEYSNIGYVEVSDELIKIVNMTTIFKVLSIENNVTTILSESGNKFILDKLCINLDHAVFTFPHKLNSAGIIDFQPKMKDKEIDHILVNNIFQSLGVFLLELLFNSDFNLRHEVINELFDKSKAKILHHIGYKARLTQYKKDILINILFGGNKTNGLINSEYVDYPSFINQLESINKQVLLLEDYIV